MIEVNKKLGKGTVEIKVVFGWMSIFLHAMAQLHQLSARRKLQKYRPFLLIFSKSSIYRTTQLFEVYALRRIGEIGPM